MANKIRKVVLFCGGEGTRMSELTEKIPKPLVPVGNDPAVVHIMRHFYRYGYREFILATGYRSDAYKNFFRDYSYHNHNVSFTPYGMKIHENEATEDWSVHVIETGDKTDTGKRLHLVGKYLEGEPFFLTYGDSFSDVNLAKVEAAHMNSDRVATVTAVPVTERFGILSVDGEGGVDRFAEKSDNKAALINGGFIACSNELLDYLDDSTGDFSYEVLTKLAADGRLGYYHHTGFWKAMDYKKDVDELNALLLTNPELFR